MVARDLSDDACVSIRVGEFQIRAINELLAEVSTAQTEEEMRRTQASFREAFLSY